MGAGVIVKLILNLVLVPIPQIGVNGAAWASVACHLVAFTIAITSLKRTIKPKLGFSKFVIKPIIATFMTDITFGLSNFISMMWKNIINATTVNIQIFA